MQVPLRFKDHIQERLQPKGIDLSCRFQHFAIITYTIEPVRLEHFIPKRFQVVTVPIQGKEKGLLSVVPFRVVDFTSAVFPFPRFTMGQTNYRVYVIDSVTGERCAWFLGTLLDSWTYVLPKYTWKLPWYTGTILFDCTYDHSKDIYRNYRMMTDAEWAPASVTLTQNPADNFSFPGFPDEETALVCLSHPLTGWYHRRDGKLARVRIWHERLKVRPARLLSANFGLLSRTGLVPRDEQMSPHSVLVEPVNAFTIYLPPEVFEQGGIIP